MTLKAASRLIVLSALLGNLYHQEVQHNLRSAERTVGSMVYILYITDSKAKVGAGARVSHLFLGALDLFPGAIPP